MKRYLFLAIICISIVGVGFLWNLNHSEIPQPQLSSQTPISKPVTRSISYKGQEGRDALTLLKEKNPVEQDKSGLVISINNRKANASKREYWAFYVNGKLASVGPTDYITQENDVIEWKVESF